MNTKTKIWIGALVLAAFVIGGLAFNASTIEAFKGAFHKSDIDKEEWKDMDKEDWAAYKEEWKDMKKSGHSFGLFKKFGDEINHEIITLDNGVQITITSDNSDIVQKLHSLVEKFNK